MRTIIKRQTGQPGFDANIYVREKELKFRVSYQEYEQICELAQESKYNSLAQFMRENLLTPPTELRPIEQKKIKTDAIYQVSRMGNSLNQLAKYCNEQHFFDSKAGLELKRIRAILKTISEKI